MKKNGFTLIELLVTISILSVVSISVYSTFAGGVTVWKREKDFNKLAISSRIAMEKITRDFRNMVTFSEIKVTGDKNSLSFPSLIKAYDDEGNFYNKIGRVSYFYTSSEKSLSRGEDEYQSSLKEKSLEGKKILSSVDDLTIKYYIYDKESKEYAWGDEWVEEEPEEETETIEKKEEGEEEEKGKQLFGIAVDIVYKDSDEQKSTLSKTIYLPNGRTL